MGNKEKIPNSGSRQRVKGQTILTTNANSKLSENEVTVLVTTCPMCAKPHCTDAMCLDPKRRQSEEDS